MRRHLPDGALQALYDGELGPVRRLRLRLHLRRCPRCAGRYEVIARTNAEVAGLLSHVGLTVDPAEAWARFVVRSGWRASRPTLPLIARLLAPAVASVVAVAPYIAWPRPQPTADLRAADLLEWIGEAVNDIVLDLCCADYDGGGLPDDGLLTLNGPGEVVKLVILYEDLDKNRSFSAGDLVRYVSSRSIR
jgi:hypothetical protein